MNVAIYARVSTRDKGQDCENQLRELRQFAERKSGDGWIVVDEYIDHASGSRSDRESFQRLFADATLRRFDMVLFWSLDRFSREGVLETLQHLQRLSNNGVDWWSLKEEYLRSVGVFRDAVLSILATIAKQERIRLSERVHAGLDRARRQGKHIGRPRVIVDRQKIQELRSAGLPFHEISRRVGVSKATVQRVLYELDLAKKA